MRKILHSDLNNFYASVECLLDENLQNVPVVVCGSIKDRHGVVLAKNMLAKSAGIKTGMVLYQAKNLCPDLVCVEAHHNLYVTYSRAVKAIYREYTDRVESFGIDEAWLDITDCKKHGGDAYLIADEIRQRVKTEIGLTVSIGVSFNKVFAKLASDMKKPDAITVVSPENFKQVVWGLPASDLLYVGRATSKKLKSLTINTIGDIAKFNPQILTSKLGKWGEVLYNYACGLDNEPVKTYDERDEIKSVGNSLTFYRDLTNDSEVEALLILLSESVCSRMQDYGYSLARSVHLTITTNNLNTIGHMTKVQPTALSSEIAEAALKLFKEHFRWSMGLVRALGVSVSDFTNQEQLTLDTSNASRQKQKTLQDTVESLRRRFGRNIINKAIVYSDKKMSQLNIKDDHTIKPGKDVKTTKIETLPTEW